MRPYLTFLLFVCTVFVIPANGQNDNQQDDYSHQNKINLQDLTKVIDPDQAKELYDRGWNAVNNSQWEEAYQLFNEASILNVTKGRYHWMTGDIMGYRLKDHAKAMDHFNLALTLLPEESRLYEEIARSAAVSGLGEEALKWHREALNVAGEYPDGEYFLKSSHIRSTAYNLAEAGSLKEAEQVYRDGIEFNPSDGWGTYNLGWFYLFRDKKYDLALVQLEIAHSMLGEEQKVRHRLAQCHEKLKDYQSALENRIAYIEIIESKGKFPSAWSLKNAAWLTSKITGLEALENIFTYLDRILTGDYSDEDRKEAIEVKAEYASDAAWNARKEDRFSDAEQFYLLAIDIEPENGNHFWYLANLLRDKVKDYSRAAEYYALTNTVWPQEPKVYEDWANTLALSGNGEEAFALHNKALKVHYNGTGEYPLTPSNVRGTAWRLGEHDFAELSVKVYLDAYEMDPADGDSLYGVGYGYTYYTNEYTKALPYLKEALVPLDQAGKVLHAIAHCYERLDLHKDAYQYRISYIHKMEEDGDSAGAWAYHRAVNSLMGLDRYEEVISLMEIALTKDHSEDDRNWSRKKQAEAAFEKGDLMRARSFIKGIEEDWAIVKKLVKRTHTLIIEAPLKQIEEVSGRLFTKSNNLTISLPFETYYQHIVSVESPQHNSGVFQGGRYNYITFYNANELDTLNMTVIIEYDPLAYLDLPVVGGKTDWDTWETNFYNISDSRLLSLAEELIPLDATQEEVLWAFAEYGENLIQPDDNAPGGYAAYIRQSQASEILNYPYGDCATHSSLNVALARIYGLKARTTWGMYLSQDGQYQSRHTTVEFFDKQSGEWLFFEPQINTGMGGPVGYSYGLQMPDYCGSDQDFTHRITLATLQAIYMSDLGGAGIITDNYVEYIYP